jgi:two-component system OmpR family response regulator
MGKTILVVDDDSHIREVIRFALSKAGLDVLEASNGEEALAIVDRGGPDLMILDITMPEMDGLEVCRALRRRSDMPILFLSSRTDEVDRVVGLEIGGDDYVTKPFSPRELVARVQVILKRIGRKSSDLSEKKELSHGLLTLNVQGHVAFWNDQQVPLTATEFSILRILLEHPEHVHSREHLMNEAYDDNLTVSDRTIDSHIRHIRNKYASAGCTSIIETVHGVGYKLGSCQ